MNEKFNRLYKEVRELINYSSGDAKILKLAPLCFLGMGLGFMGQPSVNDHSDAIAAAEVNYGVHRGPIHQESVLLPHYETQGRTKAIPVE